MKFVGDSVAVGVLMMNSEGYDEMAIFHGIITHNSTGYFLECPNQEPMEMTDKWLGKLTEVDPEMDERFQGAKWCLIIGSLKTA